MGVPWIREASWDSGRQLVLSSHEQCLLVARPLPWVLFFNFHFLFFMLLTDTSEKLCSPRLVAGGGGSCRGLEVAAAK